MTQLIGSSNNPTTELLMQNEENLFGVPFHDTEEAAPPSVIRTKIFL